MLKNLISKAAENTSAQASPHGQFSSEVSALHQKTGRFVALLVDEANGLRLQINEAYKAIGESFFMICKNTIDDGTLAKILHDNNHHMEKIGQLLKSVEAKEAKINELNERYNDEVEMLKKMYGIGSVGNSSPAAS